MIRVIKMNRFKIEKACFDLEHDQSVRKFRSDPEAYLARYCLSQAEQEAIRKGDMGTLYKMGVLTASMACLARALGYSNLTYVQKLRDAAGLAEVKEQMDVLRKRE
jgi:hypothetical protein